MLTRLDNTTVTLHTGENLTLQQHTKDCSEYLIKELESYDDLYSRTLKETLMANLDKKWSEVRTALDEMHDKINPQDYAKEYILTMEVMICEITYPNTDQDEELNKELTF